MAPNAGAAPALNPPVPNALDVPAGVPLLPPKLNVIGEAFCASVGAGAVGVNEGVPKVKVAGAAVPKADFAASDVACPKLNVVFGAGAGAPSAILGAAFAPGVAEGAPNPKPVVFAASVGLGSTDAPSLEPKPKAAGVWIAVPLVVPVGADGAAVPPGLPKEKLNVAGLADAGLGASAIEAEPADGVAGPNPPPNRESSGLAGLFSATAGGAV